MTDTDSVAAKLELLCPVAQESDGTAGCCFYHKIAAELRSLNEENQRLVEIVSDVYQRIEKAETALRRVVGASTWTRAVGFAEAALAEAAAAQ